MFVRAGLLSLALLVASRLLGLLRDTSIAAAFGTSGLADVVVMMLSVPDWAAGVVAAGALSYVLLPAWARLDAAGIARLQRQVFRVLLAVGALLALLLTWQERRALALGLPGLADGALHAVAVLALGFSAAVIPLALVSALWVTRLQHERDVTGMYGANVVVNAVIVAGLLVLASSRQGSNAAVGFAGCALVLAMLGRLGWLWWRMRPFGAPASLSAQPGAGSLPWHAGPSLWLWACLAAAAPLALPFAARSLASSGGQGTLSAFHYAWKLIELPLTLAIQLVAVLAFPAIARALAPAGGTESGQPAPDAARAAIAPALLLAWAMGWAALCALLLAAPALASLLFGWGRKAQEDVQRVAQWALLGAWCLLPMALIAVLSTVLASLGRLAWVALPHLLALVVMAALAVWGRMDPADWMPAQVALQTLAAVGLLAGLGRAGLAWLPWRELVLCAAVGAVAAAAALFARPLLTGADGVACVAAVLAACAVLAGSAALSPGLRQALRR